MDGKSIANGLLTCLVTVFVVVGFTAAPAAAASGTGISFGDDGVSIDVGDDVSVDADEDGVDTDEDVSVDDDPDGQVGTPDPNDAPELDSEDDDEEQFPEEVCTDAGEQINENAPYEQMPWFDDLPEQAQPPGVPTDVITPEAVAGIVFGVTPNQCDVQDPNDPSYDPREANPDPNADATPARLGQYGDGGVALVYYEATLNDSNEHGPGVSGKVGGLATSGFGDANLELAVHDGEKEYAVDPQVQYNDDGTGFAESDVRLLNSRLGVVTECDGEECSPDTRGLPKFQEYPAIPAPTGQDD